jgi:hypothetical protein
MVQSGLDDEQGVQFVYAFPSIPYSFQIAIIMVNASGEGILLDDRAYLWVT